MKRLLILFACLVLSLMLALPAMADVDVYANIHKTKTKTVTEDITITKDIDVNVTVDNYLEKAAEAEAVINQKNEGNYACENCAEKTSEILDSIIGNTGIVNTNQATGNMNNQSNVVSMAIDIWPPEQPPEQPPARESGFSHSQVSAEQIMTGNEINSHDIMWRDALISGSVKDNTGIVGVNQSVSNINNQLNAVGLAVSLDGVVALAEADLGQYNSNTDCDGACVYEYNTNKTATIIDSVNGNAGIVGVNQTAGNMTNQANIANIAFSVK